MDKLDLIRVPAPPTGTQVYVYLAGTQDLATIYSDLEKTSTISQPIILGEINEQFYVDDQRVDIKFAHGIYNNGFFVIEDAIIPKSAPHEHPYISEEAIAAANLFLKIKEVIPEFAIAVKTNTQPSLNVDLSGRLAALGFQPDDVIWIQE